MAKPVPKPCCDTWSDAHQSCTDNEEYGPLIRVLHGGAQENGAHIGSHSLPQIKFCPWCGVSKSATTHQFYAVVTQYDCDPAKNPPSELDGASGPLLMERYLVPESRDYAATLEIAKRFDRYGWARVATVTIDIPD